ncbi:MAG: MotA/TolQ/ExbB proton channel family protein [Thermodesulfobacteriota bacterium]
MSFSVRISALFLAVFLFASPLSFAAGAEKEEPASLEELLKAVEKKELIRAGEAAKRLRRFTELKDQREKIAAEAEKIRVAEENRGKVLQAQYTDNDRTITEFRESISRRHGGVKEILGYLAVVAGKAGDAFSRSVVSAQFTDRTAFVEQLRLNRFPSIDDIERLWFELHREVTESGRTARFSSPVYDSQGRLTEAVVVRVGGFNLMGRNGFLAYDPPTGHVKELSRQPQSRFRKAAKNVFKSSRGVVKTAIDPSRGAILSLFVRAPGFFERVSQGGGIGYVIILAGLAGLVLTALRVRSLRRVSTLMREQEMSERPDTANPLGRLMKTFEEHVSSGSEAVEIALAETVRAETARFDRFLPFIKFIYVSAPLLGLLGTVVGMIKTFQVISFFGSADPRLLAGGISQALVTTVMGLCVAIPVLLLHTFIKGRSRRAAETLEEKAVALATRAARGDGENV